MSSWCLGLLDLILLCVDSDPVSGALSLPQVHISVPSSYVLNLECTFKLK
jgi:hypothetical protein